MNITISIDKEKIIKTGEYFLRKMVTVAYQWLTTDGEILGYILGCLHFITSIFIFILVIVSHTIYPALWLQIVVFILLFIIWIQHVFLKVCISIVAEKVLTTNESPFHTLLQDLFGLTPSTFSNYLVTSETVAIGCFALELISRTSVYVQRYFMKNTI
jgi:hypothetical protein